MLEKSILMDSIFTFFCSCCPEEPFDVTPYAHAFFHYFLRNPICQEMGRKFKVSFSSTDDDSALSYMHDIGFIPKLYAMLKTHRTF